MTNLKLYCRLSRSQVTDLTLSTLLIGVIIGWWLDHENLTRLHKAQVALFQTTEILIAMIDVNILALEQVSPKLAGEISPAFRKVNKANLDMLKMFKKEVFPNIDSPSVLGRRIKDGSQLDPARRGSP